MPNKKSMERNILLHGFMRIFTKRAFLPIVGIYMLEYVGLSIQQMALIATVVSVIGLVSQIPTGYLADRYSRLASMRIGATILFIGSTFYFLKPDFIGVLIAATTLQFGYSFFDGAIQTLMHETLTALKRETDYSKVMSRAQSYGLFGNFIIVTLAGLTYIVDQRLPFVIGSFTYALLALIMFSMKSPGISIKKQKPRKSDFSIVFKPSIGLFLIVIGLIAALGSGPSHFYSLAQKEAGLSIVLISILGGAASLASAVLGFFNHHLQKLPNWSFMILDVLVLALNFLSYATRNVPLIVFSVIVSMYFFRYRMIIYEHKILSTLKDNSLKATILSTIGTVGQLNEIWVPITLASLASGRSIIFGFQKFAVLMLIVMIPLSLLSASLWSRNKGLTS